MSERDVIFIVGIGRSGTSALTRTLSLCGCTLPHSVFGAEDANPMGFWESVDAYMLNDEFLARHNVLVDPSLRIHEDGLDAADREAFIQKIEAFLAACPSGPRLLLKDPRIAELMEFWLEAARRQGMQAKVVIPIRRPQEVYASMLKMLAQRSAKAQGGTAPPLSVESTNVVWLKRYLLAERHTRHLPRVVVEYANFLRDWRTEIGRIAKALSLDLTPDAAAVEAFLTPDLHRNRSSAATIETFGYSWLTRLYAILASAAQDGPMDQAALDEIFDAYSATSRALRISMSELGNAYDMDELRDVNKQRPVWESGRDFDAVSRSA